MPIKMNTALLIITFIALIGIAIWDIKYKKIPSVILTALLFIVAVVNFDVGFKYGLLSLIFALLIYEFAEGNGSSFGIADVKVMITVGFLITSLNMFLMFLLLFALVQIIYIVYLRKGLNKKGEIPFIPAFVIIYAILWWMGGFA
jgi:hypothetical protein